MDYKIFRTKKRDWTGLVWALNYGYKNRNIKEIGTKLYNEILEKLKKEKTDGVILNNEAGTIALDSKFIPFIFLSLTKKEQKLVERLTT